MKFEIQMSGPGGTKKRVVDFDRKGETCHVALDGKTVNADAVQVAPNSVSVTLEGHAFEIHLTRSADGRMKLQCGPHEFSAEVMDPRAWRGRKQGTLEVEGRQEIVAPMPGKVVRLLVVQGERVEAGQGLLVVEAMKMQNEIRSPKSGKVERMLAQEGQAVNAGEVLAWVE